MAGAANQKRRDECVVAALYVGLIAWNVVNVQAGGGATELARRFRGALLAALVPGQDCRSNPLCEGHWLDAES
jgi:hypothetical protein